MFARIPWLMVVVAITLGGLPTLSRAAAPPPRRLDRHGEPLPPGAIARLGTARPRHDLSLGTGGPRLIFSPDGRELLSQGIRGLRRWHAETGVLVPWLPPEAPTRTARLLPDGRTVVTAAREPLQAVPENSGRWYVERWRWGQKTPLSRVRLAASAESTSREGGLLSSDGRLLVLCDIDTKPALWDTVTGRLLHVIDRPVHGMMAITLSPDGRELILLSDRAGVHVYDTTTGKHLRTLVADDPKADLAESFWMPEVSPDGRVLAISKRRLELWDLKAGKLLARRDGMTGPVAFSADSRRLACVTEGGIHLLEARELETVCRFEDQDLWGANAVCFSPDGRRLALCEGGHISIWDVATGKPLVQPAGHRHAVYALAFSADGRYLASGGQLSAAFVWDVATGRPLHVFRGRSTLAGVALSPDGRWLATGEGQPTKETNYREARVRLYDLGAARLARQFYGHFNGVHTLVFSPDSKSLATGGWDARVRLWDVATGRRLGQVRHVEYGRPISFLAGGKTLAIHHEVGKLRLVDTTSFDLRLLGPQKPAGRSGAAVVLPGEKEVALVVGGRVEWYDLSENRLVRSLTLSEDRIGFSGGLSPDGSLMATPSGDGGIELWALNVGKRFATLAGHTGSIDALAFSPDGRRLASAGSDSTILIWDVHALHFEYALDELAAGRGDIRYLAAYPERGIAALKTRLREAADSERLVRGLVKAFDNDEFARRERATQELEKLGGEAVFALRRAAETSASAEVRTRARRLLGRMNEKEPAKSSDPAYIRACVGLLVKLGTPLAARAVEDLARLGRGTLVGEEAARAVEQMRKRGSGR